MKLNLFLLVSLFLSACAGMGGDMAAPPGTRSINIVHKYSGERVNAVYADNGRYDKKVMADISKLFRDRETKEIYPIDPKLIEVMHTLLSALAQPETTEIQLTSGFRSPGRQAEMAQRDENFARRSLHTSGQAADMKIPGVKGKAVAAVAQTLQDGGVAYYPKTQHIHVDTGAIRTWNPK